MERVGVRELRQHLSRHLARVKRGESLEVTEHGRPVAVIRPAPAGDDVWQRLIDGGTVVPAVKRIADLPAPTGRIDPQRSARLRVALEEQRADRV